MFSKIKEIPIEKYDDYIINMIRDFSLNAMARVNAPCNLPLIILIL